MVPEDNQVDVPKLVDGPEIVLISSVEQLLTEVLV